ncbi:MAG: hypothetical protein OEX02_07005, partial [Cyclobacteriaceae bacterium]|nr:hypothetical protein [Cyclobacteriaceae bacterium]
MKRKITIVAFFLFVGLGNFAYSQCNDWKWPEDKTTAERMYVFHNDMVKNEQYEKAVAPHQWLLKNSPDLNKALYINGEKIFRGLADNTDDPVRQKVYVDSLMMMYDMRMEYCGNEISILNKKAYYAFKYSYKDRENDTTLLKLFDEVMKKSGKNMTEGNLKYYMTIIKMNKVYQKNLTDDQILERYDKIQEAIDGRIAAGKDKKQLESLRAEVDEMLSTIVTMDCELVRNTLGSKFKENPDDIATAEKIFKFMLQGKCTDDPLWLDAAKRVYIDKPSFGLAKNIALKCKNNGDDADAEQYLNSAIEITDDVAEKAE